MSMFCVIALTVAGESMVTVTMPGEGRSTRIDMMGRGGGGGGGSVCAKVVLGEEEEEEVGKITLFQTRRRVVVVLQISYDI
jgi:hypothetical protein